MELPTGLLAYCELNIYANILSENQELLRAILTSLTYKYMKGQLKAIYDNLVNST